MVHRHHTENLSEDKLAKLPKWAQEHITAVQREREDALTEAQGLRSAERVEGTAQFYLEGFNHLVWLPEGARLYLSTADSDTEDPDWTHSVGPLGQNTAPSKIGADLEVQTFGARIAVMPNVSNSVTITAVARN